MKMGKPRKVESLKNEELVNLLGMDIYLLQSQDKYHDALITETLKRILILVDDS